MNDNTPKFDAKAAVVTALRENLAITATLATEITEFLTTEGFIDYPVVAETLNV